MKKFTFLLGAAGALLTATTVQAQTNAGSRLLPTTAASSFKNKVYDYQAGTWSTTKSATALEAETLYDNTCFVATFLPVPTAETIVDSGRLPSTTSPNSSTSVTGTADAYPLAYFDVAYCTSETSIDFDISFFEQFNACNDATAITPTETFSVLGAPGAPVAGSLACWTVTVDLGNLEELPVVKADGNGVYDGATNLDNFGWSFNLSTDPANGATGPVVAGDPFGILFGGSGGTGCDFGSGLTWNAGTEGTGIGTDDFFEIDDAGLPSGYDCFFFGGYMTANEWSSFYLEMAGDPEGVSQPPTEPGTAYCFADAGNSAGNTCPCGNFNDGSDPDGAGCANAYFAAGAKLGGSGTASITSDTVVLAGMRGQPSNSSMFFQANNNLDGALAWLDNGVQCAGGGLIRLKVKMNDGNGDALSSPMVITARSAQFNHVIQAGETLYYQWWYRETDDICQVDDDANTSNGYEITWTP
jgi:hypothetical protein